MAKTLAKSPWPWVCLLTGFLAGVVVSSFWPSQPIFADGTDRTEKFAISSVKLDATTEGIFILDFLTGRLNGVVFSQSANMFVARYFRNVSQDFRLSGSVQPHFALISGLGAPQSRGPSQLGASMIYVAELTTGRVVAYAIPYQVWSRPIPTPLQLIPAGSFSFRERLK